MKILFISLIAIDNIDDRHLYADLMRYFIKQGHYISIYTPLERRHKATQLIKKDKGYKITRVKTLNIQKTNLLEKSIATFSLDFLMKKAIKSGEKNETFDLVIYTTPPITLTSTIQWVKNRFNCKSYLLLKDIFPQNAVDLGMIKANSLLHKYFKRKEEKLYQLSDKIGCMSQANVEYILKHNPIGLGSKIEICPNSIEVSEQQSNLTFSDIESLKSKLNIPKNKRVFIYGGNLGKPQAIDFLIQVLTQNIENEKAFFIIIGSGTEYAKLDKWINLTQPHNVMLHEYLPKAEYDLYVMVGDVGLILLDHRFSIPNYPSRLLSYLEMKKPVLCFTDVNSDIGKNAVERNYGRWSISNDLQTANEQINYFCNCSIDEINEMGAKGFHYLKDFYSVEKTYSIIVDSML